MPIYLVVANGKCIKSDSILCHWNFKYYSEIQANNGNPTIPPCCQFLQHFKHFIAFFHVLKSNIFEIDKEIKLQVIHCWHES